MNRISASMSLRLGLLVTTLLLVIISAASPASFPSISTVSVLSNATFTVNAIQNVLVYPKDRKRLDELDRKIRAIVVKGKITPLISNYIPEYKGIIYWFVQAEEYEIRIIESKTADFEVQPNDDVLASEEVVQSDAVFQSQHYGYADTNVFNNSRNSHIPNLELIREVIRQTTAPPDLRVVSWQSGTPFQRLSSYTYENETGQDTYIYVIDRGLDPNNLEFSEMPNPIEWHYGTLVPETETDDDPNSHGSCVASKAAGVIDGVSKKSHLVLLKIDNSRANIIWSFNTAVEDILAKRRQGRSVIAYPNTLKTPAPRGFPPAPWDFVYSAMRQLFANDVVIVVPSGNFAREPNRDNVDTLPATMEGLGNPPLPLVVAGAVDNPGRRALFSQGPNHVTTSAPGVHVKCAAKGSPRGSQLLSGTSFSTGTVAGLIAYFLGLPNRPFNVGGGQTALNAKTLLQDTASWPRVENGPKVIWNGLSGASKRVQTT